jgi:MFS superfamily sulfate permease-like transporter
LILRVEGRVFFVNAERIGAKLRALMDEATPKVVALDLSGVSDLEYTALKMLVEAEKRLRERGVAIWLIGLNPDVLEVVPAIATRQGAWEGADALQPGGGGRQVPGGFREGGAG